MESPDFIPDDQFKEDQPQQQAAPDFISDADMAKQPQQSAQTVAPDFIPDDQVPPNESEKYATPMQRAATAAEGVAQGYAGPLATYAEKELGISTPEEMKARREANPGLFAGSEAAGLVGGLLTGTGEAGLIARGVEHLPQGISFSTKVGSAAVKGAIQMGLIQGGDEISKSLLGQGDPEHPVSAAVSNMGAASLLGATTGGIFSAAGQGTNIGLKALQAEKLGTKLKNWFSGLGHKLTYPVGGGTPTPEEALQMMAAVPEDTGAGLNKANAEFNQGSNMADQAVDKLSKGVTGVAAYKVGGPAGPWIADKIGIGKSLDKILKSTITGASKKYIGPAILRAASSGSVDNLSQVLDYATCISNGENALSKGVEGLFKYGADQGLNYSSSEKDREKLKEFIENGGVDQQIRDHQQIQQQVPQFADGGEVHPMPELNESNAIAKHFPEQNVLLNKNKGQISGYLNSIRPQKNQQKLPYDSEQKNPLQERDYNKALDLANNPLSILKHIKDGDLLPKHMAAFNAMYPDLHNHLSKRITKRMVEGQIKEEKKPSYKTRQAMSLFLGTSLDSTLTQPSMMAAQNVFSQQNAQKQAPQSKTSSLNKMGKASQTAEQFRQDNLKKS